MDPVQLSTFSLKMSGAENRDLNFKYSSNLLEESLSNSAVGI